MAWKCDNCNHYTADGQKHDCNNDEVEQLREAAKELNADYESCLTSFTKIADENMLVRKQIQVLVAALESIAYGEADIIQEFSNTPSGSLLEIIDNDTNIARDALIEYKKVII